MLENTRIHDTLSTAETMPLFARIAVAFTLAVTTSSLVLMKVVAGS